MTVRWEGVKTHQSHPAKIEVKYSPSKERGFDYSFCNVPLDKNILASLLRPCLTSSSRHCRLSKILGHHSHWNSWLVQAYSRLLVAPYLIFLFSLWNSSLSSPLLTWNLPLSSSSSLVARSHQVHQRCRENPCVLVGLGETTEGLGLGSKRGKGSLFLMEIIL